MSDLGSICLKCHKHKLQCACEREVLVAYRSHPDNPDLLIPTGEEITIKKGLIVSDPEMGKIARETAENIICDYGRAWDPEDTASSELWGSHVTGCTKLILQALEAGTGSEHRANQIAAR